MKLLGQSKPLTMVWYAILTTFIGYTIYKWMKDYFSPLYDIPEPPRYSILGHFPYFIKCSNTIDLLVEWGKQFKDYGFYKFDPGVGGTTVVVLKSEYIKTILSKPDEFERLDFFKTFIPLTGNGLLTATGDDHRYQKKFFSKPFSATQMKYYVPVINKHVKVLEKIWDELVKESKDGQNIVVKEYFSKMTLDIIGEISFGYSFNSQKTELNPFLAALVKNAEGSMPLTSRIILKFLPFMWYLPFGPAKILKETTKISARVLDEVISTRLKLMEEGKVTETQKHDLLSMMLYERDEYFTDQLVKDSAFTFLFAGHETTATGLPGVLMYFAKHPDMQERAREEISNIISDVENLTMEQLNNLLYTDAFIKESLRLFVPTPQNIRVPTKDCRFGNVSIPRGTPLMISHVYIHKNEFEKGDKFIPERWLNGDLKNGPMFSFGYGPFACVGKHFALLEIKVTIVRLLKKFKFTIDPECEKYDSRMLITLKLYPDLKIRVQALELYSHCCFSYSLYLSSQVSANI